MFHVVGAGLAGLSASCALAEKGAAVTLYEAAPQAGGRCRSYFDPTLGQIIDNGNHFVLSGNHAVMAYLNRIGAQNRLVGPKKARTSFVDIRSNERWTIAPNDGPMPFWLFDSKRRVPGTRVSDYLEIARLLFAGTTMRASRTCCPAKVRCGNGCCRPFFLGALNTEPEGASAALAGALVRETFARGGKAYRTAHRTPHTGRRVRRSGSGLSGATRRPDPFRPQAAPHRARRPARDGTGIARRPPSRCRRTMSVILAVPPWVAQEFLPEIAAPDEFRAIVNAHFKIAPPKDAPPMLGVIGGTAEWIFSFADRISITISGADRLIDMDRDMLAELLWRDVAAALKMTDELPPWQIVKEKRATFAATLEQAAKRAPARTALGQSLSGRRLDRYRPARHHRGRRPLRPQGGGVGAGPRRRIMTAA